MDVKHAQLVISEAGRDSLMIAGITTSWLRLWIQSAGYGQVELQALESGTWENADTCQVFIASEQELSEVSAYCARDEGFKDVKHIPMADPARYAECYRRKNNGLCKILLPIGDVVYQRGIWLAELSCGQPLSPVYVWMGDEGGTELERGLRGNVNVSPKGEDILNDVGFLPEEQLLQLLQEQDMKVRFAESCTGGGMSERLARIPGASRVLDRSWVTYSNQSKQDELRVPEPLIDKHGAVSREAVEAMACAGVDTGYACVAVSGIAGPDGGSVEKPVGMVWLAAALPDCAPLVKQYQFTGSRAEIRSRSILAGFSMLFLFLR